ncbi:MAG: response regulator [Deltaproteobacteria bacterium]|nr:response regulator [Deltaproteobacteria bacterium]
MSHEFKLLVVDDNEMMAKTLKDIFLAEGYDTKTAFSGTSALDMLEEDHYDCVMSDIKMPVMDGFELCKSIKSIHPEIHVVLMTAYAAESLNRHAQAQGALATLMKPIGIKSVLDFFSALRKKRSIIIIDDDVQFCKTTGDILELNNYTVTQISDPQRVMQGFETDADVMLLDLKLNGITGLDALKKIRTRYPHLPVIIVTGYREGMAALVEETVEASAYTCLDKPLRMDELFAILDEFQRFELERILLQSAETRS